MAKINITIKIEIPNEFYKEVVEELIYKPTLPKLFENLQQKLNLNLTCDKFKLKKTKLPWRNPSSNYFFKIIGKNI